MKNLWPHFHLRGKLVWSTYNPHKRVILSCRWQPRGQAERNETLGRRRFHYAHRPPIGVGLFYPH